MASFQDTPEEWERLDWQLLQNSAVARYSDPSGLESHVSWFQNVEYNVVSLALTEHTSFRDVLRALGHALAFPEHYGTGLDSFNDCLSDVEIPSTSGLVVVLRNADGVVRRYRREFQALLDILADNSRLFLLTGARLITLVHTVDSELTFDPVGATAVMWNPNEFVGRHRR